MYRDYHSTLSSGHCKSLSEFLLHEGTTGLLQAPGWDAASSRVPPPNPQLFANLFEQFVGIYFLGLNSLQRYHVLFMITGLLSMPQHSMIK